MFNFIQNLLVKYQIVSVHDGKAELDHAVHPAVITITKVARRGFGRRSPVRYAAAVAYPHEPGLKVFIPLGDIDPALIPHRLAQRFGVWVNV